MTQPEGAGTTQSLLGTGWGFPPTFSTATSSVGMISDEDDIRSSLQILLTTRVGERVMQPRYGCDLHDKVFEPLDIGLLADLKDLIETAILYFEPRILVDAVELEDEPEQGRVVVTIIFTVKATNSRANFVYPFYLQEGTELAP